MITGRVRNLRGPAEPGHGSVMRSRACGGGARIEPNITPLLARKTQRNSDRGKRYFAREGELLSPVKLDILQIAEFEQKIIPLLGAAYNLARRLSKDADAAQDIVQEAFLRAHRSFAGYRGENARAWILEIVRNCCCSWLMSRRRKSRLEVDFHDAGYTEELILNKSSDECTPEAMLVQEAERQTVRCVLDTVPLPLREILVLREFEELSYRQISEVTALPIGTVMSRLARARRAFGDAWQREKNKSC